MAAAMTLSSGPARAQNAPGAIATVEASAADGAVRLTGRVLALAAGRYDARMKVEKSGTAGRTSTTQGGTFSLAAGESATVATVGLSMAAEDVLAVELVLTADGEEVSRSRLSVGQ